MNALMDVILTAMKTTVGSTIVVDMAAMRTTASIKQFDDPTPRARTIAVL